MGESPALVAASQRSLEGGRGVAGILLLVQCMLCFCAALLFLLIAVVDWSDPDVTNQGAMVYYGPGELLQAGVLLFVGTFAAIPAAVLVLRPGSPGRRLPTSLLGLVQILSYSVASVWYPSFIVFGSPLALGLPIGLVIFLGSARLRTWMPAVTMSGGVVSAMATVGPWLLFLSPVIFRVSGWSAPLPDAGLFWTLVLMSVAVAIGAGFVGVGVGIATLSSSPSYGQRPRGGQIVAGIGIALGSSGTIGGMLTALLALVALHAAQGFN